jgi:hypothetical protein
MDFAEELYFRANTAQTKDERKAIKGVQHSLERVLAKHGAATFIRRTSGVEVGSSGSDDANDTSMQERSI